MRDTYSWNICISKHINKYLFYIKLIDDGNDVVIPALEDAATHDTIAAEVGGQSCKLLDWIREELFFSGPAT